MGFEELSAEWLREGHALKYSYQFTWMGFPVIQLPQDLMRIQELIFTLQPNLIVETGVAHGGSLVFYASLLEMLGLQGKVIGVDIRIRQEVRAALTKIKGISLVENNSIEVNIAGWESSNTLVILDSCHTYEHVLAELRLYSKLVSVGSYIVVCDGIMEVLPTYPKGNNPLSAIKQFLSENDDFVEETPKRLFDESTVPKDVTYWPKGYLRRIK